MYVFREFQPRKNGKPGFDLQNEAVLNTLTLDVLKSSQIEGEYLEKAQVHSSIARRLEMKIAGTIASEGNVDGIVC